MKSTVLATILVVSAFSCTVHAQSVTSQAMGGANPRPAAMGGANPRPQAMGGANPRPQAMGGANPRPQAIGGVSTLSVLLSVVGIYV